MVTSRSVSELKDLWVTVGLAMVIGALTAAALSPQIFGPVLSDIHYHLLVSQDINSGGAWNLYSLFFLLVAALSFGSRDLHVLGVTAELVLVLSVIAKGILSYFFLRTVTHRHLLAAAVALALILVMPLPNWWKPEELYLDKIAPNLWFNSTFIFTMPFAVLLFSASLQWLKVQSWRTYAWLALCTLLSVLTKPNYVLALFPVLGATVLIKALKQRSAKSAQALWLYVVLAIALCGILYIQYVDFFTGESSSSTVDPSQASHFIFAPLAVWSIYSPNIPASFLLSIPFPLTVVVLYFREVWNDKRVIGAWAVLAVAVAQYVFLAETGSEFRSGNWGWGSYIAMYLVFLVSAAVWLTQPKSWQRHIVTVMFVLHLGAGIYHYSRVVLGLGYY